MSICIWCGNLIDVLLEGFRVQDGDDRHTCCSEGCAHFMIQFLDNQNGGL